MSVEKLKAAGVEVPELPTPRFHQNTEFGETNGRCNACGSKTALVVAYPEWSYDSEPFEDGKQEEMDGEAHVGDEVTGHYCPKCERLTSLAFNQCG